MSFDTNWDIDKYKEDHESEEHWLLRRNFMEVWKESYPEDRLVCLARVFANIEFMGCRYPTEVMQEVSRMSKEVANDYRACKKTKLHRTFVSASDAAEDRARGVKREGGIIIEGPPKKMNKIEFVKPGQISVSDVKAGDENFQTDTNKQHNKSRVGFNIKSEVGHKNSELGQTEEVEIKTEVEKVDYMTEFLQMKCLDVQKFRHDMFATRFGKLVLMVRSWVGKLWNIQSSCQVCGINLEHNFNKVSGSHTLTVNGILLAESKEVTKQAAKKHVEEIAWNIIKEEAVIVLIKEQHIAQNDARISVSDVSGTARVRDDEFGTPLQTGVASKMMKMMGWRGGGLGVDAQGIAEPIKPHLQMVNRAGLGSTSADVRQIKRAAESLMRRYIASDCLDVDLVFSNDFSKEERAALHQVAKNAHLVSRSYGQAAERFLVVKKKVDPFLLVQALIEKGGSTPKYQVFIPATLGSHQRRRH